MWLTSQGCTAVSIDTRTALARFIRWVPVNGFTPRFSKTTSLRTPESLPMSLFKPSLWALRIMNGRLRISPQLYEPQRTTSVQYCSSLKLSIWVLRIMNVGIGSYPLSCPLDRVSFHLYHSFHTVSKPGILKESF